MKKTYISPETLLLKLQQQSLICASVEGFNSKLDDENPINAEEMLSRRRNNVWDDEEEEEEMW